MYKSLICSLLLTLWVSGVLTAQSAEMPKWSTGAYLLERLDILHPGSVETHTSVCGFPRADAARLALALDTCTNSALDAADIRYLAADNNEWINDSSRLAQHRKPWLKVLYPAKAHLLEVNTPDFKLRLDPLLYLLAGAEKDHSGMLFQNRRGLEIRGVLDRKLFFYSNLIESQVRYPQYVTDRIEQFYAIPGAGFYKHYKAENLGIRHAYDFNIATAYAGFQLSKHVSIELGHGQQFIGNGYRSLLLSDFSPPAFFLKISTRVWRIHYQNLFLELSPVSQVQIPDGTILPKKYAAIHYLDIKAARRLSLGFFEATVLHRSRQFELQYLNPVIFYRTVEGMIGSPDNVLLGGNISYNLLNTIQLYGQLLLDELTVKKLFSNSGWWANKYGLQGGIKYINALGIDHLDLQTEFNLVRPYTYSHHEPEDSYTHYNQPLAHPLGANFREIILQIRYQPCRRMFVFAGYLNAWQGQNTATENWGANPLLSYDTRVFDYGNRLGQGISTHLDLFRLEASWMWRHNMFLDAALLYRKERSEIPANSRNTTVVSLGLRMNFWPAAMGF